MMSDTVSRRPRHSIDVVRQHTIAPTREIDIVTLASPPPSSSSAASSSVTAAATIAAMAAASSGTVSARRSPLSSASASRKMSTLQLRMFFLICVSLYLATICFADDIVRVARWVRDSDPSRQWRSSSSSSSTISTSTSETVHVAVERSQMKPNERAQEALRLDVEEEDDPPSEEQVPPSTVASHALLRGAMDDERDQLKPRDDFRANETHDDATRESERALEPSVPPRDASE
ncbi:hypothetical protein PINS_up018335 [Pythium insidiosum]|nr:hypothetical protein PINS_up018335 [Pythium insidiosum]